jgi:alkanesulfonate monooxygenase SsuD/methylene tetrahydromethanopterin reductase-like flavin-dependent oxidoreductase (luciferase family)
VIIDVQPVPARGAWPAHVDAVLAAEASGFGTAWVVDHLSGAAFGGDTMVECFTQLGVLATVTRTIGLGTLVVNVHNRPFGLLAVAAASVQAVSGGRFVLGLGAGASPTSSYAAEHHAIGRAPHATMAARHAAVGECLSELDAQWAPDRHERFAGFPAVEAPPVILGVNSGRLAALAGERTNGVNVRWSHPDRAAILASAIMARGERTGWWTTSVWAPWDVALCDPDHPLRAELAAEGVDRLILAWSDPPSAAEIERGGRRLR